jgi:hypothetical protein
MLTPMMILLTLLQQTPIPQPAPPPAITMPFRFSGEDGLDCLTVIPKSTDATFKSLVLEVGRLEHRMVKPDKTEVLKNGHIKGCWGRLESRTDLTVHVTFSDGSKQSFGPGHVYKIEALLIASGAEAAIHSSR